MSTFGGLQALATLRETVRGAVITPDDDRFDRARRPWNPRVEQHPAAVVVAADVDDVVTTVRVAAAAGLQVSAQPVGHGCGDPLDDVLLLRTGGLCEVQVDRAGRVARAGAGVQWRRLHEHTAAYGLAGLAGTAPGLSVVGYTLGGGLGLFARRYGLAANHVLAAEIVTADGEHRRVDGTHHPDLFWGLRGGGGGLGVVTAFEVELIPAPQIFAGQLIWPAERARDVLGTYRQWVDTVPEELTSTCCVLTVPPLPQVPEAMRGRTVAALAVCHLGDEAEGRNLLRPFARLGAPLADTLRPRTAAELDFHGDPEEALPSRVRTELLTDVTDQVVDTLCELGPGAPGSPLALTELRHLGGALARPPSGHGIAGPVPGRFLIETLGIAATPELDAAIGAALPSMSAALDPWRVGGTLLNFATPDDHQPERFFDADTRSRLAELHHRWDPGSVIRPPLGIRYAAPLVTVNGGDQAGNND